MGSTQTRKSMNNKKSDISIYVYVDPVDDAMGLLCKDYESGVCKGSPVFGKPMQCFRRKGPR